MQRGAVFSPCEEYRYTLTRRWAEGPSLLWVLLNPSTADAEVDDPTNRRGISFSRDWGFGACVFVNMFAYRTPYPERMKKVADPVGPDNDFHILEQAMTCDEIVIAWGTNGVYRDRNYEVVELLDGFQLNCLGTTKDGHPKHPLYLRKDTERISYE